VFHNIQCGTYGTQQCNTSISAIDMPQSANQYSVTKGKVNTLQALGVQLIVISVQQFYSVIQIVQCIK